MKKPANYYGLAFTSYDKKDKRQKKWKKQRKVRGFDDTELYDLDVTMASFILPRLRRFKKVSITYPCETPEEWDAKLDLMISAFSHICDRSFDISGKRDAEVEKGLKVFAEYFRALWW